MAVTAHFFNENMELHSYCLDCTEFSDRHTAVNIGDRLLTIAREWDIHYKVTVIVSDNAANAIAGIQKSGFRQLSCFAHSLNLVVQKGLGVDDIKPVVQKVSSEIINSIGRYYQTNCLVIIF